MEERWDATLYLSFREFSFCGNPNQEMIDHAFSRTNHDDLKVWENREHSLYIARFSRFIGYY